MAVRPIAIVTALAASLATGLAVAGEAVPIRGVVELFTSQGCSSCPPADANLTKLAQRDDLIALSYHVSYWDYLGWRDTLANKRNTQRQYDYMQSLGATNVYTPQAVINGTTHVNGANTGEVQASLDEGARIDALPVGIKVSTSNDSVVIEAEGSDASAKKAHVVLVYYDAPRTVEIDRGENTGRSMTYWNSVTDYQTAGMWHGRAERYELPVNEIARNGGCAVLLQSVGKDGSPGPILGAAVVRKPSG